MEFRSSQHVNYNSLCINEIISQARSLSTRSLSTPFVNIQDLLVNLSQCNPTASALTYYQQGQKVANMTYKNFLEAIAFAQEALTLQYQIIPGQRVALLSRNEPAFIIASLALDISEKW